MTKQEFIEIVKATEFKPGCRYLILIDPMQVPAIDIEAVADAMCRLDGIYWSIACVPPTAVRVVEMEHPEKLEG